MAAARAANAPHLRLGDDPPLYDDPPATGLNTRPVARWLGIGSCVVLIGLFTAAMLNNPIGAEIERLIRPWLEWQQDRAVAAPRTGARLPTTPEAAAAPNALASGSMPGLARDGPGAAAPPAMARPGAAVIAPASDAAPALWLPVPSAKPPASNQ